MTNLFDTQLANSFLSDDYSISYQGLVEKKLGIALEKKETRSNWLRRPLSDDQLKYAALDVEYLLHLFKEQINEMRYSKKLEWHNQDLDKLILNVFDDKLIRTDISRSLPRSQENEILFEFNRVVEKVSKKEGINSTLFFSKKSQKDFLRLVLSKGLDTACSEITPWRSELIRHHLLAILK
jgi:Ribonuclease D